MQTEHAWSKCLRSCDQLHLPHKRSDEIKMTHYLIYNQPYGEQKKKKTQQVLSLSFNLDHLIKWANMHVHVYTDE